MFGRWEITFIPRRKEWPNGDWAASNDHLYRYRLWWEKDWRLLRHSSLPRSLPGVKSLPRLFTDVEATSTGCRASIVFVNTSGEDYCCAYTLKPSVVAASHGHDA